jgi:hypothetical protein
LTRLLSISNRFFSESNSSGSRASPSSPRTRRVPRAADHPKRALQRRVARVRSVRVGGAAAGGARTRAGAGHAARVTPSRRFPPACLHVYPPGRVPSGDSAVHGPGVQFNPRRDAMCSPHHLLSNAEETTPCYYSAQLVGRGCMRDARPTPRRYVKPAVQTEPCSSRVLPFFLPPKR